jgi:thiol:disulfide interchange protein
MAKLFSAAALAVWFAAAAPAQIDPVSFSVEIEPAQAAPGSTVVAHLRAQTADGWHLYASTTPQGKPIALQVELAPSPVVESWSAYQPVPARQFDPLFDMESQWYAGEATMRLEIRLREDAPAGAAPIEVRTRFGACDDKQCLPPTRKSATATLTVAPGAAAAPPERPSGYEPMELFGADAAPAATSAEPARTSESAPPASPADEGLFRFAAVAFGFGLLSVFTPCVFPMIPITMSYFVSTQSGEKKASLVQATTFAVGVVALFTGIGAALSAVLGPFGMQQLGSNVWVNLFIAGIFFAFGASLLGAFEITIPSGAMTRLDKLTRGGGTLSTLMMGLVFALASFACTGPFVGALLAGSVAGGGMAWPIFGMLMFSSGLALPFFGLALFPSLLGRLPKAGGWMQRVKIAMSFLILAAGFKYLSVVDQMYGWHLLTRDRFLAIWIVLFALDGLYLIGLLRLEDEPAERVSLGRLAVGGALLVLAVSLIPGMFGGRLGEIDAFVPAAEYSGVSFLGATAADAGEKVAWIKDDYPGALSRARAENKPLLISFTGYSCTNCKWMKTNMFPRAEIASRLREFVLVELYTDALDESIADANQTLQQQRFRSVAIPFYAIVDGGENTLATFAGRTRDEAEFAGFLDRGAPRAVSAALGR